MCIDNLFKSLLFLSSYRSISGITKSIDAVIVIRSAIRLSLQVRSTTPTRLKHGLWKWRR